MEGQMKTVFTTTHDFEKWREKISTPIAFVPTMGNLHFGHQSLVEEAFLHCDTVVVSIFVNPTQFGPNEDFTSYPRTLNDDLNKLDALLEKIGSSKNIIVFAPANPQEIYPSHFQTEISLPSLSKGLCGDYRPGHFQGVATVVYLLFQIVKPQHAIFGQKDFQQLKVIQQMTSDLRLHIHIHGAPIARDSDGLALSSRNQYLTSEERKLALKLPETLQWLKVHLKQFHQRPEAFTTWKNELFHSSPGQWDYLEIYQLPAFTPWDFNDTSSPLVALAVYRLGKTRLLDNLILDHQL
jgi:pantoate--beta-alanine ligase